MADISSYPLGSPKLADLIIGSETYSASVNPPVYGNPTRNFSVSDLANLIVGVKTVVGTANQISVATSGSTVTLSFPTDVIVPRDFTVTRQLNVSGESSLTGTLNMNAAKIVNLQNPTLAQDAATKAYVDGASGVGGTAGTIPIFDATGLGDSLITFATNLFTITGSATITGDLTVTGGDISSNGFKIISNSTAAGTLTIGDIDNSDQITELNLSVFGRNNITLKDEETILDDDKVFMKGNLSTVAPATFLGLLTGTGELTKRTPAQVLSDIGSPTVVGVANKMVMFTGANAFGVAAPVPMTQSVNGLSIGTGDTQVVTFESAINIQSALKDSTGGNGTAGQILKSDGANVVWTSASAVLGYTSYAALLVQSGTGAPVATVMQNTTGGTIAWSRNSSGNYSGVITGGTFTTDKTLVLINQGGSTSTANIQWGSSTTTISVITGADDLLAKASVEIRIYA